MADSLFGHLAHNFSAHPENLATEALAYILNKSSVARGAFMRLLSQGGGSFPPDLRFITQAAGPDQAIPDLVGCATDNSQAVICEAKFWAGLTDHQPVTYIRRLLENKQGMLVFIAPARRFTTLQPELIRRCHEAALTTDPTNTISAEFSITRVQNLIPIVLCSWRILLNTIQTRLEEEGEHGSAADIRQLTGLCDQMDSEAFLPLRSEELSSANGSRVVQFIELVDKVTEALILEGVASKKNLRATGTVHGYGQYMKVDAHGCMLQVNSWYWGRFRETPIWFSIQGEDWKYSPKAREALSKFENETPSRLIPFSDLLLVPIFLPTGKEQAEVIASIRKQLDEVIEALKQAKDG